MRSCQKICELIRTKAESMALKPQMWLKATIYQTNSVMVLAIFKISFAYC